MFTFIAWQYNVRITDKYFLHADIVLQLLDGSSLRVMKQKHVSVNSPFHL